MSDTFRACTLPWRIWPWGVTLTHADTDMSPECSVEFGVQIAREMAPYEAQWVRVDFEDAAFASAKPHRDDEDLRGVSGYDIVARSSSTSDDAEWLRTGVCPDPGFYFSTESRWLEADRASWAARQRTARGPEDAVHFLLDGRDGYVEILASSFTWRAWRPGHPRMNDVSGDPLVAGRWTDGTVPGG